MGIGKAIRNSLRSSSVAQAGYSAVRGLYRDVAYRAADAQGVLERYRTDPPRSLKVELTNICNADCIFCGYQYETRAKGVMPDALFDSALSQYREMGGDAIHFTPVVGEPLVDKKFVDRVALARAAGFATVTTYTNGILLEDHDLERLLELRPTNLRISTSGFDADEYQRIFRNKQYPKLLRGLSRLLAANQRLPQPVDIRIELRSDKPLDQIFRQPDYREHIQPYLHDEHRQVAYLFDYDNWGGMIGSDDLIGVMRLAKVPKVKNAPCFRTYSCMVMWDGRVRACSCRFSFKDPIDGLLVGNLNDKSLREIWDDGPVRALRNSFVDGTIPNVCRSCAWYVPGDHGRDRTYRFC